MERMGVRARRGMKVEVGKCKVVREVGRKMIVPDHPAETTPKCRGTPKCGVVLKCGMTPTTSMGPDSSRQTTMTLGMMTTTELASTPRVHHPRLTKQPHPWDLPVLQVAIFVAKLLEITPIMGISVRFFFSALLNDIKII
jgi:hypothetical protein